MATIICFGTVCTHVHVNMSYYTTSMSRLDEVLRKSKNKIHPWILCVSSPSNISSAVIVCDSKVITDNAGKIIFSSLLLLLAVYYSYDLQYNPHAQQVLEFLQEKLLGDILPSERKPTAAYSNLLRAIDFIEQKLSEESAEPEDIHNDNTQGVCEFF